MINKFANLDILEYDYAQGKELSNHQIKSSHIFVTEKRKISTPAHLHPSASLWASISTSKSSHIFVTKEQKISTLRRCSGQRISTPQSAIWRTGTTYFYTITFH